MHADPGTLGMANVGLSRKVTFRSSTEVCKFMWMCVMESLCFLRVGAWSSVAWRHHTGSTAPGLIDTLGTRGGGGWRDPIAASQ